MKQSDRAAAPADRDPGPGEAAAARLRRRYPPPRVPRPLLIAVIGVLVAAAVGGVIWIGLVQANPAVSAKVVKFDVVSDTEVSYTLTVDRPDPSKAVHCRVIAQSTDFQRVGSVDLPVPPSAERVVDASGTFRTAFRATSVSLDRCWVDA